MGGLKRWARRGAIGLVALVVVAGAGLVIAAHLGERKMNLSLIHI